MSAWENPEVFSSIWLLTHLSPHPGKHLQPTQVRSEPFPCNDYS